MTILVITSYYPPSRLGWGYMQLCEEVIDRLSGRGHLVTVLTSTYQDGPEIARKYAVRRVLEIDPDWNQKESAARQFFTKRRSRERRALTWFNEVTANLKPEIIFVWDAIGLPRALLLAAERYASAATAYYFANYLPELPDEYIAYWRREPAHFSGKLLKGSLGRLALELLKREGKPVALQYPHVICVSHYLRQRFVSQGLVPDSAVVIHNGIDFSAFELPGSDLPAFQPDPLKCLVAGRVVPDKGIHTVIEAFGILSQCVETSGLASLTILGDGPADYMHHLRQRVAALRLGNVVDFMPPVQRDQMPEILSKYNVLIVSSEYGEPIARSMQEGMAMGLLVIGTITGGSGELLQHERNGLVFTARDAQSLATQLARAGTTPGLGARLAQQGQEDVRANFDIRLTVERIEKYLLERCLR